MMELKDKIYILDGAMGTMIQRYGLVEADYHCGPFENCIKDLKGNNECLNLTRPDIIKSIHKEYIASGADIIETNTFSANRISQSEYGCEEFAAKMAYEGARIAREAADEAESLAGSIGLSRKVLVAGSIGPTSKSLSLASDVSDPSFRQYSFDDLYYAYCEQVKALLEGGVDILLIETCFDALNVKAALAAISTACASAPPPVRGCENAGNDTANQPVRLVSPPAPSQHSWAPPPTRGCENAGYDTQPDRLPVIISVSVGDRSGRTLTGQTLEAFYTAVSHIPLMAFGINCSLGATEMMPLLEDINLWCRCAVSCYPNAGLPNEMGGYDQSPEEMADAVSAMARKGLVNIVGGCCGTTPEHIKAIASALKGISPRPQKSGYDRNLKVSGLEAFTIDKEHNNFTNIGERTNVAGSRKFARLISEGKYEEAVRIAAKQIEDGASVIDINMDDAMLDSTMEMEKFVRYISNDPAVAKAALMIDSSHWDTIIAGLKNAQGKCIVNSISLKDGEDIFIEKARTISSFGAAMVVMAFDEKGQATTYDRKIEICERAYRLLTEKAGILPHDIIFDVNILSIGTGIDEHSRYAIDFIEAVRWIKKNLSGALTSGGVSNLSFSFRGNNTVRESMHSAFLYHAVHAGLDMAIVNPSMLRIYDDIEPDLLKCVEDVIFDRDNQATERLIEKASEIMEAKTSDDAGDKNKVVSDSRSVRERLTAAIIKGSSDTLETDIQEAMAEYGKAVSVIEGPLMEGMESVGKMFGDGKMFLPQVVKAAKVMKDAVEYLNPYMTGDDNEEEKSTKRPIVVIATVKGDVHDIGKNITGIVLTCNGFDVHDLGVMVEKDDIINEAVRLEADIVAVSGLITPSLYQMEEICKEMSERGMKVPLFIGGATTSALHTSIKLAPLYDHVYYGADASASAVMAKKYMMDPAGFEAEQHKIQENIRLLHAGNTASGTVEPSFQRSAGDFLSQCPEDISPTEINAEEILPYFDWRMFYAIWGVKYGSAEPEAAELIQLRNDAQEELEMRDFKITVSARFFMASASDDMICFTDAGEELTLPMMRQESGQRLSLCDFIISKESGRTSPFGVFAISVSKRTSEHTEGCCCPACSNRYEDMIGRTVRQTLAEAASKWLDSHILSMIDTIDEGMESDFKIIKPAAGYSSCPDHTLKRDILHLLGEYHGHNHCNDRECADEHKKGLGISLTESYAMIPDASICGMIFLHPHAVYPEIRQISRSQYESYSLKRGMDENTAKIFLGHLIK